MGKLVKGIHHVAMKCFGQEEYNKVKAFYKDVLGLEIVEEWKTCTLFDTGAGVVEVFTDGSEPLETGVIRHFAFAVDDVEACVAAVKAAGYEVFMEPKEVCLGGDTAYPAKVAFCRGPLGEEIEFFCQRW